MELWLDTANVDYVASVADLGILQGVTTNPSIVSSASMEPEELIRSLLEVQSGWVAVQVLADDAKGMYEQARIFAALSPRILVKIPVTQNGIRAIHALSKEGIPTLGTAIFEVRQALLAFKAGANYLAPYLGRIADTSKNPSEVLASMEALKLQYGFSGKIMGAGIREINTAITCVEIGISAMTLSDDIFAEFIQDYGPTLAALKKFSEDWANVVCGRFTSHMH